MKRFDPAGLGAYEMRLDPEVREFVALSNTWFPPETTSLPIASQREIYNEMCRALHCGTPQDVCRVDTAIHLVDRRLPVRRYRVANTEPAAVILYYHGGGFVLGDLDSHDDVCAALCDATGFEVNSVDYRLAPEHRHPAAFEDACALFDWAAESQSAPLLLSGESAGGNLAAAVAHARREAPRAAIGQVLIYPTLGSAMQGPSYRDHAEAPMLSVRDLAHYRQARSSGAGPVNDPRFAPLDDGDFSGLPPTVIVTAEYDPLSSDGALYRSRIRDAGGLAHWYEAPGLVHSFLRARRFSSRARDAFGQIAAAARALGRGEWPY
ncbi:MAG: alpha/beta hydrolase [Dongiaceae bacterium]